MAAAWGGAPCHPWGCREVEARAGLRGGAQPPLPRCAAARLPQHSHRRGRSCPLLLSAATTRDGAAGRGSAPCELQYELVKGDQVDQSSGGRMPFTAVLLHGILGGKRNLLSFAKRLAVQNPAWQFLLVDLRNHGSSAAYPAPEPHTLTAAAGDVLHLLSVLKLFPHALIGHSFGGKVAMEMVFVFGRRLPRPVQVWVLDTVPGDVYADGGDHPRDVINFVRRLQMPLTSRKQLVDILTGAGFTLAGAQWMTTNLQANPDDGTLDWTFNITGIAEMYASYEATDLWPLVEAPPQGALIDFVRAERSAFRWREADVERLTAAGARVHMLYNSGHWCVRLAHTRAHCTP